MVTAPLPMYSVWSVDLEVLQLTLHLCLHHAGPEQALWQWYGHQSCILNCVGVVDRNRARYYENSIYLYISML